MSKLAISMAIFHSFFVCLPVPAHDEACPQSTTWCPDSVRAEVSLPGPSHLQFPAGSMGPAWVFHMEVAMDPHFTGRKKNTPSILKMVGGFWPPL